MNGQRLNDIIFMEAIYNFLGELLHRLAAQGIPSLLVFVHVEELHGGGGDILALVLGAILEQDVCFDGGEGLVDHLAHGLFDQSGNESALGEVHQLW